MVVPIGAWKLYLRGNIGAQWVGQQCAFIGGLSKDVSLNIISELGLVAAAYELLDVPASIESVFVANVKTPLYIIGYSNRVGQDSIFIDNQYFPFVLKATSVYI